MHKKKEMRSSYMAALDYSALFKSIVFALHPQRIVEFGILDGYSLRALVDAAPQNARIEAYDIFEDFVGNHADQTIREQFADDSRISIAKGSLFDAHNIIDCTDAPIDIFHVDIANDGSVVRYVVAKLLPMLAEKGVIIMEGGTPDRDKVKWMQKYQKPPIVGALEEACRQKDIEVCVVGTIPGVILLKRKKRLT
jgi:predicted O-methyltransferase YrrM